MPSVAERLSSRSTAWRAAGVCSRRPGRDHDRRRGRARELAGDLRRQVRLTRGGERLRARLRHVQSERGDRERDQEPGGEAGSQHRPAHHTVDDPGPEPRFAGGSQLRQERDSSSIDARTQQLEQRGQDGDRPGDRACDHDDRSGRDAVEDVRADHELAGHRDRDGRSGDQHRAAGGARRALKCLARRRAASALLARAHDVEQRVVDADRHPDQQHDGLDAVVEREHLADRTEQAERRDHRGRPPASPARARRRARRTRSAARTA